MKTVPLISVFIPCLVDQVYPEIGLAMVKVLSHLGCQITYNSQQTCCGQPAFNAGHRDEARKVAKTFINVFSESEVIVGPSGSCTAMVKNYYPILQAVKKSTGELSDIVNSMGEPESEILSQLQFASWRRLVIADWDNNRYFLAKGVSNIIDILEFGHKQI